MEKWSLSLFSFGALSLSQARQYQSAFLKSLIHSFAKFSSCNSQPGDCLAIRFDYQPAKIGLASLAVSAIIVRVTE